MLVEIVFDLFQKLTQQFFVLKKKGKVLLLEKKLKVIFLLREDYFHIKENP